MQQAATATRQASPPRRRGGLALAIGVAVVAAALLFAWRAEEEPARRIALTAGEEGTTRSLVANELAVEVRAHGIECAVIAEADTQAEVESLRSGAVDFALVSALYRSEHRDPHVRVVAPLHVEALHLLVKQELGDRVRESLGALAGRSVDLGPSGSAGTSLAGAVLAFAELEAASAASPDGFVEQHLTLPELRARIDAGDRDALPDAVFHLGTMPSLIAHRLVREHGYVVAPLPFAEAFRLHAILSSDRRSDRATDVVIPPFLYHAKPAVPAEPLPTLGARLLLLAHDRVSEATVERVLAAAYDTRFARMLHPTLDRSLLAAMPRRELHSGAIAYLGRREPAVTGEAVSELSNTLSVLGALAGGFAFVVQGWRQRRRARREQIVAEHLLQVAAIERRIVESELAATLDLDALIAVQRELLELKGAALARFTSGELDDQSLLSELLGPINAARDHVGELLLHVRGQLEEKAAREGRARSAVWSEAAADAEGGGTS